MPSHTNLTRNNGAELGGIELLLRSRLAPVGFQACRMAEPVRAGVYDWVMVISVILGYIGTRRCGISHSNKPSSPDFVSSFGPCRSGYRHLVYSGLKIRGPVVSNSGNLFHSLLPHRQCSKGTASGPRTGWGFVSSQWTRACCQVMRPLVIKKMDVLSFHHGFQIPLRPFIVIRFG